MTDDLLARAQQALEGVTPGPWRVGSDTYHDIYGPDGRLVFEHDPGPRREDAEFIAAARTLIPELIDALTDARDVNMMLRDSIKKLRAENQRLRDQLIYREDELDPRNPSTEQLP